MRRRFVAVCALVLATALATPAAADWIALDPAAAEGTPATLEVVDRGPDHLDLRLEVSGLVVVDASGEAAGYRLAEIPGESTLQRIGYPAVPVIARWIAAPPGSTVELLERQVETIHVGPLAPVQPSRYRDRPAPAFAVVPEAYASPRMLPSEAATLESEGQLRRQPVTRLEIHPARYVPATGELEIARSLELRIHFSEPMPPATPEGPTFDRLMDLWLVGHATSRADSPPVPESMLMIVSDDYLEVIDPLVQWKTRRGIEVTVRSMGEVGSTAHDVFAAIQEAYTASDPPLTYVLLVGDETGVPTNTVEASDYDGQGESDFLFTLLEGDDLIPDVLIGRLPAKQAVQVETQVSRLIRYEREVGRSDPDAWIMGATGIGSSGTGAYDPDYVRVDRIITAFEEYGYTDTDRFFESQWHPADPGEIVESINAGRGWVAFMGHGSGTGWYFDQDWQFGFENSHIAQLTNDGMWPVVMDVACSNGDFTSIEPCFAEAFTRAGTPDSPRGAASIYSSTIPAAWDEPAEMEEGVVYCFLDDREALWGEALLGGLLHMQEFFGATGTVVEVAKTFVNFGDPSLVVRSRIPTRIQVEHPFEQAIGASQVRVAVADEDGVPLSGAVVALSDGLGLVDVALTDAAGNATFAAALAEGDTLDVVVTGFDLVTYEGQIVGTVSSGDDDDTADDDDDENDDDRGDDDGVSLSAGDDCSCRIDGDRSAAPIAVLLATSVLLALRRRRG